MHYFSSLYRVVAQTGTSSTLESTDTIPPAKITLLFVGDLMQHQAQLDAARTDKGTYDYSPCFSLVKEQISGADIAIGNLEVPIMWKTL